MTLIEQIKRDRADDPGNVMPTSEQIEALSRRWGRVTAMEEALLAAVEALKAIERGDDSADGMPGVIAGAALDAMGVGQ